MTQAIRNGCWCIGCRGEISPDADATVPFAGGDPAEPETYQPGRIARIELIWQPSRSTPPLVIVTYARGSRFYGRHPNGMDYTLLVDAPPVAVAFDDIIWPEDWELPWGCGPAPRRGGSSLQTARWCLSLNLTKLEKVRELGGGIVQARCPACAEAGQDRKGEHLRILADGRFGCCVYPKDGEHRKRIFALSGERLLPSSKPFTVRVACTMPTIPALRSVKAALTMAKLGTPGTGKSKSVNCVPSNPEPENNSLGTLGTAWLNPYAYRKNSLHTCKDSESGVPSVPTTCGEPLFRLPFMTAGGDLSIPFDSPERYHW